MVGIEGLTAMLTALPSGALLPCAGPLVLWRSRRFDDLLDLGIDHPDMNGLGFRDS